MSVVFVGFMFISMKEYRFIIWLCRVLGMLSCIVEFVLIRKVSILNLYVVSIGSVRVVEGIVFRVRLLSMIRVVFSCRFCIGLGLFVCYSVFVIVLMLKFVESSLNVVLCVLYIMWV